VSGDVSSCRPHVEIPAKVNVKVDRGVADLVRALSRFPRLETVASCEDPSRGIRARYRLEVERA